ncbi:hypothetical protein J3A78_000689 [Streptomyces sp. PvR006]|uniref:DUF3626 domain-containing protein n=1 Tax=Streptomyces sp. PvR006 TaxID=2817860 RepID=UPI001AE3DC9B|nr:DUF3626 domain-containing protein [Streptomyces sp. PvR006]MBP2580211.1 hypothetical protein [Streptomyces sp. PvR006]
MTRTDTEGHPDARPHHHARRALTHVAARSTGGAIDPALRVTLNFHPHFLGRLADEGVYRSQFVTGTSNGGLTAHPGGDRWRWESRIFGGAYDNAPADTRPVYGALDVRRRPFGAAPRFGSAHLRLTAAAVDRATFCYPDSHLQPAHFGVAARMGLIARAESDDRDLLDDYIEAQIHGPVQVARDVEALVLDPSHRGTEVEAAARRLPCPVEWHGGFRLSVDELRRHPWFRGREYVELGARIAVDGRLDPRIVQEAAGSGRYDPQDVKKVWHCLARFGAPDA